MSAPDVPAELRRLWDEWTRSRTGQIASAVSVEYARRAPEAELPPNIDRAELVSKTSVEGWRKTGSAPNPSVNIRQADGSDVDEALRRRHRRYVREACLVVLARNGCPSQSRAEFSRLWAAKDRLANWDPVEVDDPVPMEEEAAVDTVPAAPGNDRDPAGNRSAGEDEAADELVDGGDERDLLQDEVRAEDAADGAGRSGNREAVDHGIEDIPDEGLGLDQSTNDNEEVSADTENEAELDDASDVGSEASEEPSWTDETDDDDAARFPPDTNIDDLLDGQLDAEESPITEGSGRVTLGGPSTSGVTRIRVPKKVVSIATVITLLALLVGGTSWWYMNRSTDSTATETTDTSAPEPEIVVLGSEGTPSTETTAAPTTTVSAAEMVLAAPSQPGDALFAEVTHFCLCEGPHNDAQIKIKPRIANNSNQAVKLSVSPANMWLVALVSDLPAWTPPPGTAAPIVLGTEPDERQLVAFPPNPSGFAESLPSGGLTFATHWVDQTLDPGETSYDPAVKQGDLVYYVTLGNTSIVGFVVIGGLEEIAYVPFEDWHTNADGNDF